MKKFRQFLYRFHLLDKQVERKSVFPGGILLFSFFVCPSFIILVDSPYLIFKNKNIYLNQSSRDE